MCCDCTHPEALRATGNEKEQVVCVPLAGHIPVCCSSPWEQGPEVLLELLTLQGLLPRQLPAVVLAEIPPQQDQNSLSWVPIPWLCSASSPFSHVKRRFFGKWSGIHCSLLQSSPAAEHLLCVLGEGSTKGLCGAGAGTTQLPLHLQSSGKAQGSEHVLLC